MRYRRFGKTGLDMPVISCGGMRYQQSWNDKEAVSAESQRNLKACIHRAIALGVNHIETARGYGTSEEQLGRVLPDFPRDELIVQTKIRPNKNPEVFKKSFEKSMRLLRLDYVDLLGIHGINDESELDAAMACLDTAEQWRKEGRVRHIGFSTHGATDLIVRAIETEAFEYVNVHWYYIFQDNWPAIQAAAARDMGVFIISPNDKGGKLYAPSERLAALCDPLHPMVFNDLYCLARPEVHTLSCGVARPGDFDAHLEAVARLDEAETLSAPIAARLDAAYRETLGADWADTWREGLPDWREAPAEANVRVILQLYNLAIAFGMTDYARMRYNLLGNGATWFPGQPAADLDHAALEAALAASPHRARIPGLLAKAHHMLAGPPKKRLQEDE